MGLTHFPHGVSSFGLPLIGSGTIITTGNVFFVDSGHAARADSTDRGTYEKPFATLDYAIGRCTANNGDHIIVAPGHTETIAAAGGITVDVAGITIVGIGYGADRPTFNFTATTSTILVTAASTRIINMLFTGGIDAVATMFTISAADCEFVNCETRDVTGQMTSCITTTAGADRLRIDGYTHLGAAGAGANNCIEIVGGDRIVIRDVWIDGNFDVAAIENVTTAATNLTIHGGGDRPTYIRNRNAADVCIACVATSTGYIGPNIYAMLTDHAANITEAFVGAAMVFHQPISICNLAGEVGMNTNIPASTDA